MALDLTKHPDTADHPAILLGMQMMMSGMLSTKTQMKDFIEGVN